MNNLHFTFKSNYEILFDKEIEYIKENDYYVFSMDDWKFKFYFSDNNEMHFIRESFTDIFEINKNKNEVIAKITLKEENISFIVKLLDFEYIFLDDKHIINYNIESDEESIKTIILKLN